jgi:hypothetical protein
MIKGTSDTTITEANIMPKTIRRTSRKFTPTAPITKYLWHLMADSPRLTKADKLKTFLDRGLWLARLDTFVPKGLEGRLPAANLGLFWKLFAPEQVPVLEDAYRHGVKRS